MKFLLSLSLKNLWRYRRRTMITAGAIAAGIMLFIWTDSLILGIEKESERSAVLYETGSAQILDSEYYRNRQYMPLKYVIADPDRLVSALDKNRIPASKRVSFGGEIIYGGKSQSVRLFGIDLDTCSRVFRLDEILAEGGNFIRKGQPEIMLGEELAGKLGITTGSYIDIRTRTKTGVSQIITLRVVGFINSLNMDMNEGAGLLPLEIADSELEMNGAVTEIALSIPEHKNLRHETGRIETALGAEMAGKEIHAWNEIGGALANMMGGRRSIIFVILGLLAIISAVGISNTMLIAVFERIREIGTMRAMGMADRQIRMGFIFEAFWIGLIGSLIGVVLALGLNAFTIYIGLDYGSLFEKIDVGMNVPAIFRGAWNFMTILIAPVIGVILSALVTLFPARRALRMDITECLSHR
ncbi:MAG: ABC transporter permease [Spirochaetales bacterium]|nr:ABC transporter permease [Spirochaetales bacterium]